MAYVIPEPDRPVLPVQGTADTFPIRRIYCVGRNYAAHAREMGADDREPPFFFAKPADAVVAGGGDVPYPPVTRSLHHEVELVVAIGREGTAVTPEEAAEMVFGFTVGVDLTRRDLQVEAKAAGKPWDMAKGFDASAPMAAILPLSFYPIPDSGAIYLEVDDATRQEGDLKDMIWSVPEIIAALSRLVTLKPGDLIMTGTPEGVGPVERGQTVRAKVAGLPLLTFTLR